eukprot:TRINITY_DN1177_c1_g1_i1.p1 TRINITY_DN1177_c1_g1~~TRINITY_DN1177_c1_g1_i1.p1  ORF type:complete len:384 (+),score=88.39 TRINITY_DN1177_c1_g1_i1:174-1325(+)
MDEKFLVQSMGMSMLFEDPITFEIMENATVAGCGHSFSESTIKEYVRDEGKCPLCNKTLAVTDLMPNYKLREAITQYQQYKASQDAARRASSAGVKGDAAGNNDDDEDSEEEEELHIPKKVDTEALVRQINPGFKSQRDEEKLIVEVIGAKNLKNQRGLLSGTSSPYCTIQFQGRMQQTSVARSNLSPTWNECFLFEVKTAGVGGPVTLEIKDKHIVGRDTFMGKVEIPWDSIAEGHKVNADYALTGKAKAKITGSISIKIRYVNLRNLKEEESGEPAAIEEEIIRVKSPKSRRARRDSDSDNSAQESPAQHERRASSPEPVAAAGEAAGNDEGDGAGADGAGADGAGAAEAGADGAVPNDLDEQFARALQNQFDAEGGAAGS